MGQAVIAEVIAERSLGQLAGGVDIAADAEVGLGMDGKLLANGDHGHAAAAQRPGKGQFAHAFGQGITAATVIAGGPPTNTFTRSGFFSSIAAA